MIFYEDLALLQQTVNKQTLFLAHMVSRMDSDNIVQMTPYVREAIIIDIGCETKNKLALARQYLKILCDDGLVSDLGKGAYMVVPKLFGFSNIANAVDKKQDKYIKIKYSNKGRSIEVGLT